MKKTISILIILVIVTLGAMHGHYSYLHSTEQIEENVGFFAYLAGSYTRRADSASAGEGKKDEGEPGDSSVARRTAPPKPLSRKGGERRTTGKPAVGEIKPPKEVVDVSKVPQLLEEARGLYLRSEYNGANKRFDDVVSILTKTDKQNSPECLEAAKYARRSQVFQALAGSIPTHELSDGRGLSEIDLDTGKTIIVRVLRDDGDVVKVQLNNGIETDLTSDQIDDMNELSPEAYRRMLKKEYETRYSKVDADAYFDVFGVALYAIQNKLREETTSSLEQTFALPGSELVLQTFYTGSDVDKLVVALLESFDRNDAAKKYLHERELAAAPPEPAEYTPEPGYGDEYPDEGGYEPGEGRPEPELGDMSPPVEPEPRRPARRRPYTAKLDEAGQYFAAGQRLANEATRNVAKRFKYGPKAKAQLEKALDILNPLLDLYPGSVEVEQMLAQVSGLLQYVNKNLISAR